MHTDSKTNRMTEDSEPVEQHHFRYFGQNIHYRSLWSCLKSVRFKTNNNCIQQGSITFIKVTVKTFVMLQNINIF